MVTDTTGSRKRLRNVQSREIAVGTSLKRMLEMMSDAERRRLWWLIPLLTANALVQVLGIASVMPFLALLANTEVIAEQAVLAWTYEFLGFEDPAAFTMFMGVIVLLLVIASNAFAALSQYMLLHFSWGLNHTLSVRMLQAYLSKPYVFFLGQNSSALSKNILGEVRHAVKHFVIGGMNLIAQGIVAVLIIGLLIVMEPVLALFTFGLISLGYAGVYFFTRKRLSHEDVVRSDADQERYTAASEALEGVKEIKLLGKERTFLKRYERPSRRYTRALTRQQVISVLPRYALETIAIGAMLVIVLYLMARGQGLVALLPTLGLYAFASYRLLPKLQGVFSALVDVRFALASVEVLHQDLQGAPGQVPADRRGIEPLAFDRGLELRDVTFSFPNSSQPLFQGLNLMLEPKTSVAFVGSTGAGKSTLVDLLLGILQPQVGDLVVDGRVVDESLLPSWQANLGYVPQAIYLADDTVAANIAFGWSSETMDVDAVHRAAKLARIHDFIVNELPHGYETTIGERGVRLSGGQRQRLGIARALFNDPAVIVLDEATSALDNVTEESVFEAVRALGGRKTIVMIAHRISTVRDCDVIYVLDQGRVVAGGTYAELAERSDTFRALARLERTAVLSGS